MKTDRNKWDWLLPLYSLLAVVVLLAAFDYGNRRPVTDTVAEVVYKRPVFPCYSEQPCGMLVLARGRNVWTVQVSREFYLSVQPATDRRPGDHLMLTRNVGAITGMTFEYLLAHHHQPIPITQTEELHYE